MTYKTQIKEGYLYKVGNPKEQQIITSSLGAIQFAEDCLKEGMPEKVILHFICIADTLGIVPNTVWTPLYKISWDKPGQAIPKEHDAINTIINKTNMLNENKPKL